jgi:putative transposase
MSPRPKLTYHPYLIIAFHLHCLPEELRTRIPRSTRFDWSQRELSTAFGFDWACQQHQLFATLQQVACSKKLLRVNIALLRIIAIGRFMQLHAARFSSKAIRRVVLETIEKVSTEIKVPVILKCLHRSFGWLQQLRNDRRCPTSSLLLCRLKHPGQLLVPEIETIKAYCSDPRFLTWPLVSVYHQLRRDKAAAFQLSTFYKYVGLLQLKRKKVVSRRKNHAIGIRSDRPLGILHADLTLFRTADNVKSYIYLIQDNFSRAILCARVSLKYSAEITLKNLERVHDQYLAPAGIPYAQLVTDDGSENFGVVSDYVCNSRLPKIDHVIAQKDIVFSNSMIEAANKQLKYGFLYHQHIADHGQLKIFSQKAVEDYNNRPHHRLGGLTPLEALNGGKIDKAGWAESISVARQQRLVKNKQQKCCFPTF